MNRIKDISVILACLNGEKTLARCLDSINRQGISLELVFINDGSTDDSLSIFKKFDFNENIEVKLIDRENKGFQFSLDEGIRASTRNYIARIDADDYWCDNHIELIMQEFNKNKGLVLIGSDAFLINEVDQIIGKYKVPHENSEIVKYLHKDCPFIHSSVIFRKDIYLLTNGYFIGNDKRSMIIADYNLWFELSKFGLCKNIKLDTIYYRLCSQSMSRTVNKYINYSARYVIMKKVNKYYKRYHAYSFFHRSKVKIRIIQHYILTIIFK